MFEMFFPFGTERYLAIKLFAKRKQLIRMVAKTGAERSKEYREKNEQARKLIKLKYSVKTSKKRISDSAFDLEFKRKEADRKRKYLARKSSEAESERNEVKVALLMENCGKRIFPVKTSTSQPE